MAKKGIDEMIEELEYYIEHCKVQTFSNNKIVIPRDELLNMVREIKVKIPSEIEQCNRIMENKDAILADARKRADDLLSSAREDAQRRVSESEVMQMAVEQARELMKQATEQASEMIEQAGADSDAIRLGALHYTNNVMMDLSEFTTHFIQEEESKYNLLINSLKDTLNTIETNRAQITAQLATGETPSDEVKIQQSVPVEEEPEITISEVKRVHTQEKKSNRPGFRVPEVGAEEGTNEKTDKNASTVSRNSQAQEDGAEDEIDDLDQMYLDEF